MAKDDEKRPIIIIKRVKKGGGGHHGGAWKVAYADFVTAMMAFFLLLWLLNVTTDEQKSMISAYFAPADPRVAESTSGAGGVMGGTTMSPEGAMTSELAPVVAEQDEPVPSVGKDAFSEDERESMAQLDRADEAAFQKTEEKIREQLESVPELKELSQNLLIDMTPEGLRIQIIDQDGKPMFASGSSVPLPPAVRLLQLVGASVRSLPNQLSVRGHTDSTPYGKDATYTNWELSADRANASRRVLLAGDIGGRLPIERIENVQGKADREPLNLADPTAAQNRRISIILLKQSLVAGTKKPARKPLSRPEPPPPRKQEEGVIYFP